METQTQIDRLIELAIIQRSELKQLVEQLPQLREHLNAEVEKVFDETEPQLRAELEEWTTKQTADKTAALGVALEAKIADLAKSLEVSTQARYNAIIAEREENARLAAQAEAKIAEHAASLPSAVKDIVTAELARFPRAGEIDQLRKEFAEPRGLNPRGKWQAGETYNKLDLVTINGDSYTSNTDGNRTRPSRSSADWTLVAARGTGGGGGPTSLSELTTVPSDGDLLIGSGTSWVTSNLTAGAGISITVGPGAITISATDGDITLDDGTAASPSLHFTNDADTGIYRPAANTLGISTSGVQRMYVDENGITTVGAGATFDGSVHAANGNANNPSFSFTSDQDTGFFRHQPNEIGIALGGTQYATLTSTTFSITPVVTMASSLRVNGTTDSSSKDTGAIVTEGGLGVEKSATIGGNLTVSGTGTSSFAGPVTGTSSTNGYQWTLTGSGVGGPSLALDATNATVANRYSGLTLYSGGTFQWGLQLRAGDGKFHIYDGVRGADALTVAVGPSSGVAGTTTVGGNLTVSGTGTSSVAGTLVTGTTSSDGTTQAKAQITGGLVVYGGAISNAPTSASIVIDQQSGGVARIMASGASTWSVPLCLNPYGGNVLLGTTTDGGQKLQVAGTAEIQNTLTVKGAEAGPTTGVSSIIQNTTSANDRVAALRFVNASSQWNLRAVGSGDTFSIGPGLSGSETNYFTLSSAGNATFAGKITANGAGSTFKGTATNDSAAAGYVGEYVSSTVVQGSAVSLTTATTTGVTSISLTAGDWDIDGNVNFIPQTSTVRTRAIACIFNSVGLPAADQYSAVNYGTTDAAGNIFTVQAVKTRYSLSATTTIYLTTYADFSGGTLSAFGSIRARRVR